MHPEARLVRAPLGASGPNSFAVAVMAKASAAGRTKTRLCPPLTGEEAANFNTAFLRDVALNLAAAGREAPVAAAMAFGPTGAAPWFEARFGPEVGLLETWLPDFGACLLAAARGLFALGHEAVGLLNADSPTLPTVLLVEAARHLARPGDRIVLGPSTDGGYYLLGLKHPHPRLFEGVAWSTEAVADQTRERAGELGLEVVELAPWYDVDDAAALRTLRAETLGGAAGLGGLAPFHAPNAAAELRRLLAEPGAAARLGF